MKGFAAVVVLVMLSSCATGKRGITPPKLSLQAVQSDYAIFRQVLEETHPGLDWYTSRDSMTYFFEQGSNMLRDSMTEQNFRLALSYVVSKIRCGHTSVRPSKRAATSHDSLRTHAFPLHLKIWPDTALVTAAFVRNDTLVGRGAIITAIDGRPINEVVDSLFTYLSTDGYNQTHKYQTLSNRGVFGALYLAVYGYKKIFKINFIDTLGGKKEASIPIYIPVSDTTRPRKIIQIKRRQRKKAELEGSRAIQTDTALNAAFMTLNTFTKNGRLPKFFRHTFKRLKKEEVQNLVIDLRGNGGGAVTNSNLLTKYITNKPFKIADSLYAVKRNDRWGHLQDHRLFNWLFLRFMTRRSSTGLYHFRYFERKYFKPKTKHHFNGQVYVLSGGNTFSASTLFIKAVKAQQNVTVVGEETGGGAYGNNAWLLPDVTLPHTKVRFKLPLFRLVADTSEVKGFGVQPEVFVGPTTNAIRINKDYKMEAVIRMIQKGK